MRDDFSERLPSMGDGNIDVGVENLDLIFEETAVDNVPDNNDVDDVRRYKYLCAMSVNIS